MSCALAERPPRLFEDARRSAPVGVPLRPESSVRGRLTLEQRLESVWEDLAATGEVECPLCRGRMTRSAGATAGESARCGDCGSALG